MKVQDLKEWCEDLDPDWEVFVDASGRIGAQSSELPPQAPVYFDMGD